MSTFYFKHSPSTTGNSKEMSMSQTTMDPFSSMFICFFPISLTRRLSNLAIRVTRRVSHKKQEMFTIREPLSSSLLFGEVCVTHIFNFSVLCVLFCKPSFFVLSTMLPVSLDRSFMTTTSVFSNIYLSKNEL